MVRIVIFRYLFLMSCLFCLVLGFRMGVRYLIKLYCFFGARGEEMNYYFSFKSIIYVFDVEKKVLYREVLFRKVV